MLIVFAAWFFYTRKCCAFVSSTAGKPGHSFLHIFNTLSIAGRLLIFVCISLFMLLPLLLYVFFIVFVGIKENYLSASLAVLLYAAFLLLFAAFNNLRAMRYDVAATHNTQHRFAPGTDNYSVILLKFIITKQPLLFTFLKLYTCGIVYLISRNNTNAMYDSSFPFLFFSIGVLGNGTLLYRTSLFEASQLSFYRSLPVSLFKRMRQYSLFVLVLLIPEVIIVCCLTPTHLHISDACSFIFSGFGLLLLAYTITLYKNIDKRSYTVALLMLFFTAYIFLLYNMLYLLAPLLIAAACLAFFTFYYRFEQNMAD